MSPDPSTPPAHDTNSGAHGEPYSCIYTYAFNVATNRDRRLPAWSGFSEIQAFQRYTPALYIIDYDKSQTTEVRKETHACTL